MTPNELIEQLFISFNSKDSEAFLTAAREYIEREKRMKHTQVARLERYGATVPKLRAGIDAYVAHL